MRAGMYGFPLILLSCLLLSCCDGAAVNFTEHGGSPLSNLLIRPASNTSHPDPNSHRLPQPANRQRSQSHTSPPSIHSSSPPSPVSPFPGDLDLPDPSHATPPRPDLFHEFLPVHNHTLRQGVVDDIAVGSGDGELPDVFTVAQVDAFGISRAPLEPGGTTEGTVHNVFRTGVQGHGAVSTPGDAGIPEILDLTTETPEVPGWTLAGVHSTQTTVLSFSEEFETDPTNATLPERETNFLRADLVPEVHASHNHSVSHTKNDHHTVSHPENDHLRIITSRVTNSTPSEVISKKPGNHSMAMFQMRDHRILDANVPDNMENTTSQWKLPLLPEQRNQDTGDAVEQNAEANPEGWTPFTIPHSNLPQFLFSTLMMEPLTGSTEPSVATRTTGRFLDPTGTSGRFFDPTSTPGRLATIVEEDTTTEPTVTSTTERTTSTKVTVVTETTGRVGTTPGRQTTHPKPMIFWSDRPENGQEVRTLFEDEGVAGEVTGGSGKDTLDYIPKQNLSRDAIDNLVTILLKYVGQPEFQFNSSAKKVFAEMVFWPILYAPSTANESALSADVLAHRMHDGVMEPLPTDAPWPLLRFIAPTPKLLSLQDAQAGVWVVSAYAVYKDTTTNQVTVMPRARLLTLVYESELKLMQKMNLQLSRVYPGIPSGALSINETRPAETYHPLFERFSSLFIPLIVLAAICVFVAVITVACLVKKAQHARHEQHLKETHEKILRPLDVMGVDNPLSDDVIKSGELRPHTNGTGPPAPKPGANGHKPVGTGPPRTHSNGGLSAKEMYETEGWPLDPAAYPHPRRPIADEEDTKL